MLLDGIYRFYDKLPEMEFIEKVYHCMLVFQAPYKAVLISLYEYADSNANERLKENIIIPMLGILHFCPSYSLKFLKGNLLCF